MSFKLKVSPDMTPDVQIVAYAILPSETVIANSADFSTEKCFGHKVSVRRRRVAATVAGTFTVYSCCVTNYQCVALYQNIVRRSSNWLQFF